MPTLANCAHLCTADRSFEDPSIFFSSSFLAFTKKPATNKSNIRSAHSGEIQVNPSIFFPLSSLPASGLPAANKHNCFIKPNTRAGGDQTAEVVFPFRAWMNLFLAFLESEKIFSMESFVLAKTVFVSCSWLAHCVELLLAFSWPSVIAAFDSQHATSQDKLPSFEGVSSSNSPWTPSRSGCTSSSPTRTSAATFWSEEPRWVPFPRSNHCWCLSSRSSWLFDR